MQEETNEICISTTVAMYRRRSERIIEARSHTDKMVSPMNYVCVYVYTCTVRHSVNEWPSVLIRCKLFPILRHTRQQFRLVPQCLYIYLV